MFLWFIFSQTLAAALWTSLAMYKLLPSHRQCHNTHGDNFSHFSMFVMFFLLMLVVATAISLSLTRLTISSVFVAVMRRVVYSNILCAKNTPFRKIKEQTRALSPSHTFWAKIKSWNKVKHQKSATRMTADGNRVVDREKERERDQQQKKVHINFVYDNTAFQLWC